MISKCDRKKLARRFVEYVRDQRNYRNINLSREEVSSVLGVTKGMLTSAIHDELQSTFPDLVNKYRAYHAHRLLMSESNSDVPLDEIAIRSGFSNRMTMHRTFIKVYGISPGKIKKDIITNANG